LGLRDSLPEAGCTLGVQSYFTERRPDPVLLPESITSSAPQSGLSLIDHPTVILFFYTD
jgi:hypothetical protein